MVLLEKQELTIVPLGISLFRLLLLSLSASGLAVWALLASPLGDLLQNVGASFAKVLLVPLVTLPIIGLRRRLARKDLAELVRQISENDTSWQARPRLLRLPLSCIRKVEQGLGNMVRIRYTVGGIARGTSVLATDEARSALLALTT